MENTEYGFDDEKGDYNIVIGDHIAYRYEIVDFLGKGSFGTAIGCIDHKEKRQIAIKVVKNKMAPPFAKVEFDLMYGDGISLEGDVLDLGVKYELIDKSGAWYSVKGERIGQGREQAIKYFKENPKLTQDLRAQVLKLTIHKDRTAAAAGTATAKTGEKTVEKMVTDKNAEKAVAKKH